MQVRPAIEKFYRVAGRCVSIEDEDTWSGTALAHLFQRWFVTPAPQSTASIPDCRLRMHTSPFPHSIPRHLSKFELPVGGMCYTDNETFYLEFDCSTIVFGGAEPAAEVWLPDRYEFGSQMLVTILSQAFGAALRRCGVFELHSAAVISPETSKTILIAGPSGSGKSTIALQLSMSGWRYVTDDVVWLTESNDLIHVNALRRFFALTQETVTATQVDSLMGETDLRYPKARFDPQHVFPNTQVHQAKPDVIVFTAISGDAKSRLSNLDQAQSMSRLLRLCPWACYDTPIANKYLRVLNQLARSTSAFELLAGKDMMASSNTAPDIFSWLALAS